ncbi:MAG: hypothetical protein OXN97_10440 [Bryobacterales bacterium]|nr:hypothetical protein [Bryobacterales bacterium]
MGSDRVIAIAMGDVDWLPKAENLPTAHGALLDADSLGFGGWMSISPSQFTQWTRMREHRRSVPSETVCEAAIESDRPDLGWTLFGAGGIDRVGP